jgi:con80 domain of Katanin
MSSALRYVEEEHSAMMRVLVHRLQHARAVSGLWGRAGPTAALEHCVGLRDMCFAADALRGVVGSGAAGAGRKAFPRWPESDDVSWLGPLTTLSAALLQSRFEDHVTVGLAAVEAALVALEPLFSAAAVADADGDERARHSRWLARSAASSLRVLLDALQAASRWKTGSQKRAAELADRLARLLSHVEPSLSATLDSDALLRALRAAHGKEGGGDGGEDD